MIQSLDKRHHASQEMKNYGKKRSHRHRASVFSVSPFGPRPEEDVAWIVRTQIPFSSASSKNAIYGRYLAKPFRPFLKKESRDYRNAITLLVRSAMNGIELKTSKLWIDIHVEKPTHRSDAINVIDLVCDAIKDAIPLDDRWYSIRRLDWSINKSDPQLFIGLSQEFGAVDSKACQACGRIMPLENFTTDRSAKTGRGGKCKSCRLRVSETKLAKEPTRRTWR